MNRILVVDDAATVRLYLRSLLQESYEVDEARNGVQGMEKAIDAPYDLYIVDINMPKLDGFGFLRALRAEPIPQAPAIVASTQNRAQDRQLAWKAGANLYLTKPLLPDTLKAGVRVLLGEGGA